MRRGQHHSQMDLRWPQGPRPFLLPLPQNPPVLPPVLFCLPPLPLNHLQPPPHLPAVALLTQSRLAPGPLGHHQSLPATLRPKRTKPRSCFTAHCAKWPSIRSPSWRPTIKVNIHLVTAHLNSITYCADRLHKTSVIWNKQSPMSLEVDRLYIITNAPCVFSCLRDSLVCTCDFVLLWF